MEIVVAMSSNCVIGKNGQLPWKIPEELQHFKNLTNGHVVIMGRKTYQSIGHPLPNRVNIVISTSLEPSTGIIIVKNIEECIVKTLEFEDKKIFVIGGSEIYKEFLDRNLITKIHLSHIKGFYEGDVFFSIPKNFKELSNIINYSFRYIIYENIHKK